MNTTLLQFTTNVTQKGQITLPKRFRDQYGITVSSKVRISSDGTGIQIAPTKDILSLAGTFKPKRMKPVLKSREEMEKTYQRF